MNVKGKTILLFGGTTEGREIAGYFEKNRIAFFLSVASAYGREVLPDMKFCSVLTGRLDADGMERFIEEKGIDLVVDATHPYAVEVSKNIRSAVKNKSVSYVRIVREGGERIEKGKYFKTMEELIEYLNTTRGNILVTTGSKELAAFCAVDDFCGRIFARVLPIDAAVLQCIQLGFQREHIITGRGPFSREENEACLGKINGKFLVTKDTGSAGGFFEKAAAAEAAGAELLVLERPDAAENGLTVREFLDED